MRLQRRRKEQRSNHKARVTVVQGELEEIAEEVTGDLVAAS